KIGDRHLRLRQARRGDHLHGACDLLRALDASDALANELEIGHAAAPESDEKETKKLSGEDHSSSSSAFFAAFFCSAFFGAFFSDFFAGAAARPSVFLAFWPALPVPKILPKSVSSSSRRLTTSSVSFFCSRIMSSTSRAFASRCEISSSSYWRT